MLAWEVFVFRDHNAAPSDLVVHWMTGVFGLDWLDHLVADGKAIADGGNDYPNRYRISAGVLIPILARGLPPNRSPVVIGDDYALPEGWNGDITWRQPPQSVDADVVLFLEVWDQS